MIVVDLPLKTGAGLNDRKHWAVRAKEVKRQRGTTKLMLDNALREYSSPNLGPLNYALRIRVRITRISAGTLDSDNLQGALKPIRDGIADSYKFADNSPYFVWEYAQEKCKRGAYGVRIHIEPAEWPTWERRRSTTQSA